MAARRRADPGLAGPLRKPRVAQITFEVSSAAPFAVEPFVERIAKIPGFADTTPDILNRDALSYTTQFTYGVVQEALSGRFAEGASN